MDYHSFFRDDFKDAPNWAAMRERCRSEISEAGLAAIARAGRGLDPGEIVCCAGRLTGAETIAALADNSDATAVAIDDPQSDLATAVLGRDRPSLEAIGQQLADWGLDDRVWLAEGDIETFLAELKALGSDDRIGLFVDCGRGDYRSQLLRLWTIEPWLADRAAIAVMATGTGARLAIADFLRVRAAGVCLDPRCVGVGSAIDGAACMVLWNRKATPWPDGMVAIDLDVLTSRDSAAPLVQAELIRPDRLRALLYDEARIHHARGRYADADRAYRHILDDAPDRLGALRHLGLLHLERGEDARAIVLLWRAIAIGQQGLTDAADELPETYYGLGLAYTRTGDVPRAVAAYQQTLELAPAHFAALNNLGQLLDDLDRLGDAAALFDRAIVAQPHRAGGYLNRARVWLDGYDFAGAIACYRSGLKRCTDEADRAALQRGLDRARDAEADPRSLCRQLAAAARDRAQPHRVLRHDRRLYDLDPTPTNARSLVASYRALNRNEDALEVAVRALDLTADRTENAEDRIELHLACVQIELACGRADAARDRAATAARNYPDSARLQLQKALLVPMFYEDRDRLELARADLFLGLEWQEGEVARSLAAPTETNISAESWLDAFRRYSHVYVNYQGLDDRPFQTRYGQLLARLAARTVSQFAADRPLARPQRDRAARLKIGFISSTMGPARLGELTVGWLEAIDRQRFALHGYYIHPRSDALTARFRAACDRFHHFPSADLAAIARTIADDDLDSIVYTDLGLDPQLLTLAALRLAPVQCTTWAHPVTTGLPTIDVFLSSAAMEPDDGDRHYSERLVRLADIGIVFPLPAVNAATEADRQHTRQQFGLAGDRVLLLCCQALLKYLPQDDWIWAEIADRVPDSQLVFISHPSPELTDRFRDRLGRAFVERGLDFGDRVKILPRLSEADYLRVNQCCDVFLDSFRWSGGVTTLKAIACGLPVVTCPGALMRSRHSAGILQTIGMPETIADSPEAYIDLAVRLATDAPWREALRQVAADRHGRLYDNTACVGDLEAFFLAACRGWDGDAR